MKSDEKWWKVMKSDEKWWKVGFMLSSGALVLDLNGLEEKRAE